MNSKYPYKVEEKDPEFLVQLPRTLLKDLQKTAKESGRTLNTEILVRLIRTLDHQDVETLENGVLDLLFKS